MGYRYIGSKARIADEIIEYIDYNGEGYFIDAFSGTGIVALYIVDGSNGGTDGQYPEALMKLQDKQGFCLLLDIEEADYSKAELSAVFYGKDIDGLWQENEFAPDKLSRVELIDNQLFFDGESILSLLEKAKEQIYS